jgi:hypothetical protein
MSGPKLASFSYNFQIQIQNSFYNVQTIDGNGNQGQLLGLADNWGLFVLWWPVIRFKEMLATPSCFRNFAGSKTLVVFWLIILILEKQ